MCAAKTVPRVASRARISEKKSVVELLMKGLQVKFSTKIRLAALAALVCLVSSPGSIRRTPQGKQSLGVLGLVQSAVRIESGKVATYTFSMTDVCSKGRA